MLYQHLIKKVREKGFVPGGKVPSQLALGGVSGNILHLPGWQMGERLLGRFNFRTQLEYFTKKMENITMIVSYFFNFLPNPLAYHNSVNNSRTIGVFVVCYSTNYTCRSFNRILRISTHALELIRVILLTRLCWFTSYSFISQIML